MTSQSPPMWSRRVDTFGALLESIALALPADQLGPFHVLLRSLFRFRYVMQSALALRSLSSSLPTKNHQTSHGPASTLPLAKWWRLVLDIGTES